MVRDARFRRFRLRATVGAELLAHRDRFHEVKRVYQRQLQHANGPMKRFVWIGLLMVTATIGAVFASTSGVARTMRSGTDDSARAPELGHVGSSGPNQAEPSRKGGERGAETALRQQIAFVDLGGGAVAWEVVRIRTTNRRFEAVTNEAGVIWIESDQTGPIQVAMKDEDWTLVRDQFTMNGDPLAVQAFKQIKLEGTVRVRDGTPLDLSKITLRVRLLIEGTVDESSLDPWLFELMYVGKEVSARPSKAGHFFATVPRIRGLAVTASAPGWYAASTLAGAGDRLLDARAAVQLELRRAHVLNGSLFDDAGHPLAAKTEVRVYITIRGAPDELTVAEALRLRGDSGCGMVHRDGADSGEAIATFIYSARTDRNGRFSVAVQQRGDVVARAYSDGHAPATLTSTWDSARERPLNLVAVRAPEPSSLLILRDGAPAVRSRIQITELVPRGADMTITVRADSTGSINSSWLECGKSYVVAVAPDERARVGGELGTHRKYVEWHSGNSINVALSSPKTRFNRDLR